MVEAKQWEELSYTFGMWVWNQISWCGTQRGQDVEGLFWAVMADLTATFPTLFDPARGSVVTFIHFRVRNVLSRERVFRHGISVSLGVDQVAQNPESPHASRHTRDWGELRGHGSTSIDDVLDDKQVVQPVGDDMDSVMPEELTELLRKIATSSPLLGKSSKRAFLAWLDAFVATKGGALGEVTYDSLAQGHGFNSRQAFAFAYGNALRVMRADPRVQEFHRSFTLGRL
jgi:hypothetical protein